MNKKLKMEAEEKKDKSSKSRQSNAGRPWWMMPKLLADFKASWQSTISHLIYPSKQEIADFKENKDKDGVVDKNSRNNTDKRIRGKKRKRFCPNKKKRKAASTPDVKHARGTKRKFEDKQQPTLRPRKNCSTHKRHKRPKRLPRAIVRLQ